MQVETSTACAALRGRVISVSPQALKANVMNITNAQQLKSLERKDVKCMVTGMMVEGKVIETSEDKHCYNVTVKHKPVQWGNQTFTKAHLFQRKADGFGSIKYLETIKK